MRDRLILLPGWGLGVSPLEPLAAALHGLDEHLRVEIEPLPALLSNDPDEWLEELDATVPQDAWLGGWSLGGMLASALAARRGERCCGLLTLASNPSFVAHEQWPCAMDGATFDGFLAGCATDPRQTLKRFSLLCAQGSSDPRGLSRLLLAGAPGTSPEVLMAGLELLAQLDTRAALQRFRGPQLHLFAGLDALVPAEAAGELLVLLPDVEIGLIEQAGHGFLLEDPHGVAGAIQAFLHESGDD
ncbi:pimeloyl-[acyl-carrier protein] methyl ester esterase [Pseudomonas sp. NFACC23-1]|uniref:alpha/beta fold hydrolase n=1 Tax=unclassified Pseudomonas TaxID=196821 RepID=UPI00088D6C4C|nr:MULTISPECIES: alpha/beta fold hydrolase [unclassified Pseudomonas]SDB41601.1 pimeloyl-[acyl-carrier protein] methyl ester esterase [Pseudomonas sp. NFACC17-2]SEJ59556.1 pimeloyl-[acyl-carrier protein] methyl ester esterase [Pseudomonas sp. NFACC23-1]SFW51208.1 pimeloyl-[acyl-carrier protein] methyl ester esterase [Pseudomonas sp. NFACC16-2]